MSIFGDILGWFEKQNSWWPGWVCFLLLFTVNVSLFLPGVALILGAGYVFGYALHANTRTAIKSRQGCSLSPDLHTPPSIPRRFLGDRLLHRPCIHLEWHFMRQMSQVPTLARHSVDLGMRKLVHFQDIHVRPVWALALERVHQLRIESGQVWFYAWVLQCNAAAYRLVRLEFVIPTFNRWQLCQS